MKKRKTRTVVKEKRKREVSPETDANSSRAAERQQLRRKSSRLENATDTATSSKLVKSLSKVSVSEPEVRSGPPFEVVIFKYKQTDPIAVAFQQQLNQLPSPAVTLAVGSGNLALLPVGFEFINYLRLGKGAVAFDSHFTVSCSCSPGASSCKDVQKCTCIDEPGDFTYSRPNIVRGGRSNQKAIIECHKSCLCGPDCRNSVVQRGRQIPLEIFWAGTKGWGLRCPEKLPRGALVEKYFGEVIGPREASRRAELNDKKGSTYLFNLDKFENPRAQYHAIDGENIGGVARFINHSCGPNLMAYAVVSDRRDCKVYDIAFFTNRVIHAGEELTYDYVECLEGDTVEDETSRECLCGSKQCRGRIF